MADETAIAERLRYRMSIIEHSVLLAALRARRERRVESSPTGRRRAVFMSPFPPSQHGTVSRFSSWPPLLAAMGWDLEILTPCSDQEFEGFGRGNSRADLRFFRACMRNQWSNIAQARDADVVVLHRGLLPFSPWQRPSFERELARLNPHLVFDFFDAIWLARHAAGSQASRPARWLNPPEKIEQIIRLARVVTVSNDRLADWAKAHHDDVRVIPMLIDVDAYPVRRHEQRAPLVIGWVGNRHQLPRLLSLAKPLRQLATQRDIVLRVVSSDPVEIPGVPLELRTHPWSPDTDRDDFADLDIGLLVLEDTTLDRGKSPFKLLQYAAAGIPVVASPVAAGLKTMRAGESFLSAESEQEWLNALLRLADDPELRRRMGAAAREAVRKHYSFHAYAKEFDNLLRDAAA